MEAINKGPYFTAPPPITMLWYGQAWTGFDLRRESDNSAANIAEENITTAKQTQSETNRTNNTIFLLDF